MKKFLFISGLSVLLTGCITLKGNVAFKEPTEGERAKIRVVVPYVFNNYRGATAFPNKGCVGKDTTQVQSVSQRGHFVSAMTIGFENNLNGKSVGVPLTPFAKKDGYEKAEAYIVANEPIMFNYFRTAPGPSMEDVLYKRKFVYEGCTANVGFIPKENADYELVFPSKTTCEFQLNRLETHNNIVSAIPVPTIDAPMCKAK